MKPQTRRILMEALDEIRLDRPGGEPGEHPADALERILRRSKIRITDEQGSDDLLTDVVVDLRAELEPREAVTSFEPFETIEDAVSLDDVVGRIHGFREVGR